MEIGSIPDVALSMRSAAVSQQANIKMLKSSMDLVDDTMSKLLEGLDAAMTGVGQKVDSQA